MSHWREEIEEIGDTHAYVQARIYFLIVLMVVLGIAVLVFERHRHHRGATPAPVIISNGPVEKDTSKVVEKIDTAPDQAPAVEADPVPPETLAVVVDAAPEIPVVAPPMADAAPTVVTNAGTPSPPIDALPERVASPRLRPAHHAVAHHPIFRPHRRHDHEARPTPEDNSLLAQFFKMTARLAGVLR